MHICLTLKATSFFALIAYAITVIFAYSVFSAAISAFTLSLIFNLKHSTINRSTLYLVLRY